MQQQSGNSLPAARVLNKFQENQFEKVERLLELREIYKSKVQKIKKKQNVAEDLKEINQEVFVFLQEVQLACTVALKLANKRINK